MAGCGILFVALVTMALAVSGPDESVTSDLLAGGADEPETDVTPVAPSTPTPTTVPAAPASDTTEDDVVVDTDPGAAPTEPAVDARDVVPEDFVPVFVADDLTDTGAHTSATPVPATPPPPVTSAPRSPQPTPPPAPVATEPPPPPVPTATPTPDTAAPDPSTPAPEPQAPPRGGGQPSAADWAALRACESGGNYGINTGNGYFGAYQFSRSTWDWVASTVRPDLVGVRPSDASPADQDALALALYGMQGPAPWPTCGAHLR